MCRLQIAAAQKRIGYVQSYSIWLSRISHYSYKYIIIETESIEATLSYKLQSAKCGAILFCIQHHVRT